MMKQSYFGVCIFFAILSGLLVSCKEKIYLDEVDTRTEVNMGVALPVGTMRVQLGDIMALNAFGDNVYINEDGTFLYLDTSHYERTFHHVTMEERLPSLSRTFDFPISGTLTGPLSYTFTFDLDLEMSKLNLDDSKERFDSLLIESVRWISRLNKQNISDLQWDWIEDISLILGPQCYRPEGDTVNLYTKDLQFGGFDSPIDAQIDNFSMCLMKDRTLNPAVNTLDEFKHNVVNVVPMKLAMTVTIPAGESLSISPESKILYHLDLKDMQYQAIWGYFEPEANAGLNDTIDIEDEWDMGSAIRDMKMPFSEPELSFDIRTQIAAFFEWDCNALYTWNKTTGERAYATFNGSTSWKREFKNQIDLSSSTLGQEALYTVTLNNTDSLGHIDNWFTISPQYLVYQLGFNLWDPQNHPQIRVPANPNIQMDLVTTFPMVFNKDVYVHYEDTVNDVELSAYSMDSLLASIDKLEEVKPSIIYLILHADNTLPISVKGMAHFYDAEGNDLRILDEPLSFVAKNKSEYTFEIHETDFDKLASTNKIIWEVEADDKPLQQQSELYPIKLTYDESLILEFGLAGNVNAVFNFNY